MINKSSTYFNLEYIFNFSNVENQIHRLKSASGANMLHLYNVCQGEQFKATYIMKHTTYSRNNMGQKCEGNCGLWVLNEIFKKKYPENLKTIVGAVWVLHAKWHSQSTPIFTKIGLDWLCYLAGNSQTAPTIFFKFSGYFSLIIS